MNKTTKKYGVDKNGFIVTKTSAIKIKKPFSRIVAEVKADLLAKFADQMHSIYIYGSIATGEAKLKKSDLDVLVVFKKKPSPKLKSQIENVSEKLSKEYKTFVREVGIALSDVKEVHADTYGWGCFMKHLCVDIYGENLSAKLAKFKPTERVAQAFNGDCKKVVESAIKKLSANLSKEDVQKICSSTMRKIVRTGFSLVMDQEKSWTTDLEKSYLVFAKYYPEQKAKMKEALDMALTPTSDKDKLIEFLKGLKLWLPLLNSVKKYIQ